MKDQDLNFLQQHKSGGSVMHIFRRGRRSSADAQQPRSVAANALDAGTDGLQAGGVACVPPMEYADPDGALQNAQQALSSADAATRAWVLQQSGFPPPDSPSSGVKPSRSNICFCAHGTARFGVDVLQSVHCPEHCSLGTDCRFLRCRPLCAPWEFVNLQPVQWSPRVTRCSTLKRMTRVRR